MKDSQNLYLQPTPLSRTPDVYIYLLTQHFYLDIEKVFQLSMSGTEFLISS